MEKTPRKSHAGAVSMGAPVSVVCGESEVGVYALWLSSSIDLLFLWDPLTFVSVVAASALALSTYVK